MIKAVIIDDELHCLDTLSIQLSDYCKDVEVVATCLSAREGMEAIDRFAPELVFLDIEMPGMNGFEMLMQYKQVPFSVIFTTSYNQYAIKAIKFSALDYLLKPVDPKELAEAVEKIRMKQHKPGREQFDMMMGYMQQKVHRFHNIAIPTIEGFELVPAAEIEWCEAEDNYTHLHLKDGRKITACRTLREVEEQLKDYSFFLRVHHSYMVNLNEIARYIRGEGGYLVMNDGVTINVSRSRKESLMQVFDRGRP
ncbi:MAG: LytTR family DNA-binding domain-containing protein [Chitinophagaceae bacterium]|jgi:two-component system LytT family response regulator|nr:LytTR family DNA-binding domain-containing protein [Chitinophagaceae bacterium]